MYCSGVYEILVTNQLITAALYRMSVDVILIGVLGTEGPVKICNGFNKLVIGLVAELISYPLKMQQNISYKQFFKVSIFIS